MTSALNARRSVASRERSTILTSGTSGLDLEPVADSLLEPTLGIPERGAERAAVLDRMRHVAQVRLAGVVHERREHVLDVATALLDDARDDHAMLGDRIEERDCGRRICTGSPAHAQYRRRRVARGLDRTG